MTTFRKLHRDNNNVRSVHLNKKSKKIGVLFFDTFYKAKQEEKKIHSSCDRCDQLNVVIADEGNMDDTELLGISPKVKVYAGAAWFTIHKRREEEGWYGDK